MSEIPFKKIESDGGKPVIIVEDKKFRQAFIKKNGDAPKNPVLLGQVKGNLHLNGHQNAGWSIQTARVDKNGTGIQIDGVDTKNRMN